MFWSVDDFCDGFLKLIDHLELDKVKQAPSHWYVSHGYCTKSLFCSLVNYTQVHALLCSFSYSSYRELHVHKHINTYCTDCRHSLFGNPSTVRGVYCPISAVVNYMYIYMYFTPPLECMYFTTVSPFNYHLSLLHARGFPLFHTYFLCTESPGMWLHVQSYVHHVHVP